MPLPQPMPLLEKVLPELAVDLHGALVRLGRGAVADQLREVAIEGWSYDEAADVATIHVRAEGDAAAAGDGAFEAGETISLFDELGIDVVTDARGKPRAIEIVSAEHFVARLGSVMPERRKEP
jgi:hypothetical protein